MRDKTLIAVLTLAGALSAACSMNMFRPANTNTPAPPGECVPDGQPSQGATAHRDAEAASCCSGMVMDDGGSGYICCGSWSDRCFG
jgi:hypothetical protein